MAIQVAREAGVSRGLLHYYFGTKERLLVEVVRRECEVRCEQLGRNTRGHLADALRAKHEAGVLRLRADPAAVASFLFALADGLIVRRLSEPDLDMHLVMGPAIDAARALLT